ncbi:helix-turn-helix domain-containing protein [Tautonia plasticadhaerens]|nr:helix-turn-helix domain-containing protein [Tautonia plasticadhaerens]
MGLDAEVAVDLALASVARFLGDRSGPVPEPEEGTLKSIAESVARIEDRLASGLERPLGDAIAPLVERLSKIEGDLTALTQQRAAKDSYSTEEVARIVGRSDYTVREWCRYGRLRAVKRKCGRGRSAEWSIPHEELMRYRNEGLLPLPR